MTKDVLHRPALEAVLHLATSPNRWRSASQLASDCGFTPSTFSNALSGRRGLSPEARASLCEVLGISPDALTVPWVARPGDLRTSVIERRLLDVSNELADLTHEFRTYQRGD